jgi:hypothetical protein
MPNASIYTASRPLSLSFHFAPPHFWPPPSSPHRRQSPPPAAEHPPPPSAAEQPPPPSAAEQPPTPLHCAGLQVTSSPPISTTVLLGSIRVTFAGLLRSTDANPYVATGKLSTESHVLCSSDFWHGSGNYGNESAWSELQVTANLVHWIVA